MPYSLTRENPERDLKALRELLDPNRAYIPAAETFDVLREIRDSIEEQVKPAIEEPKEFGSIVRAGCDAHAARVLWVRTYSGWFAETQHGFHAYFAYFAGLHDPEVLRVGMGEAQ